MDVKFFRAVAAAFPDVLLIPEQSNLGYYAVSAPYGQLNMGVKGTPEEVLWAYPQAFRVFTVGDADIAGNLGALVTSVRRGCALLPGLVRLRGKPARAADLPAGRPARRQVKTGAGPYPARVGHAHERKPPDYLG